MFVSRHLWITVSPPLSKGDLWVPGFPRFSVSYSFSISGSLSSLCRSFSYSVLSSLSVPLWPAGPDYSICYLDYKGLFASMFLYLSIFSQAKSVSNCSRMALTENHFRRLGKKESTIEENVRHILSLFPIVSPLSVPSNPFSLFLSSSPFLLPTSPLYFARFPSNLETGNLGDFPLPSSPEGKQLGGLL